MARSYAGSRVRILVNGIEAASGSGFNMAINPAHVRVDCIGDAFSKEITPVGVTVQWSIAFVAWKGATPKDLGLLNISSTEAFLRENPSTIVLYDHLDDEPIATLEHCRATSYTVTQGARELLTANMNGEAIRFREFNDL